MKLRPLMLPSLRGSLIRLPLRSFWMRGRDEAAPPHAPLAPGQPHPAAPPLVAMIPWARPTFVNASTACVTCSGVCAAESWTRMRA